MKNPAWLEKPKSDVPKKCGLTSDSCRDRGIENSSAVEQAKRRHIVSRYIKKRGEVVMVTLFLLLLLISLLAAFIGLINPKWVFCKNLSRFKTFIFFIAVSGVSFILFCFSENYDYEKRRKETAKEQVHDVKPYPLKKKPESVQTKPEKVAVKSPEEKQNNIESNTSGLQTALQPVTEKPASQTVKSVKAEGISISYNQVIEYLSNFFEMEKTTKVDGRDRYVGKTTDQLAILEIFGDKENIYEASVIISFPNDAPKVIVRNTAIMLRFLENTVPEWINRNDWALNTLKEITNSDNNTNSIILGNKKISMQYIKIGLLMINVKHSLQTAPQPVTEKPASQTVKSVKAEGISISYNQIMKYLSNFFEMKETTKVNGRDRHTAFTTDYTALLEIIGDKENIYQANVFLGLPNDAPEVLVRNTAIMLRFLENIVPEWTSRNDWANNTLKEITKSDDNTKSIIWGNKKISMQYVNIQFIKITGIMIIVKHK